MFILLLWYFVHNGLITMVMTMVTRVSTMVTKVNTKVTMATTIAHLQQPSPTSSNTYIKQKRSTKSWQLVQLCSFTWVYQCYIVCQSEIYCTLKLPMASPENPVNLSASISSHATSVFLHVPHNSLYNISILYNHKSFCTAESTKCSEI